MKYNVIKYFIIFSIMILTLFSCTSFEPKEKRYADYTYEQIIKKHGKPLHDNVYTVDNNYLPGFEYDASYWLYFTQEELENGVQVRKLIWEKPFNQRILVWLKNKDNQWIVFDSLEYNSKFVKF